MNNNPIGIFDSGIGGLTVLKEAMKALPNEDFIYFCDQSHVPYGNKSPEDLKIYINEAILELIYRGAKAIVLACNTATSLFISDLRAKYPIPFIGMEPALKPAFEMKGDGNILVLATPITFEQDRFWSLKERVGGDDDLIVFPAEKLAGMIEKNIIESGGKKKDFPEVEEYLKNSLSKIDLKKVSVVVLGCTHYLFIKEQLEKILPSDTKIVDGNKGTVKHLKEVLENKSLLSDKKEKGFVRFYTSDKNSQDTERVFGNILENI